MLKSKKQFQVENINKTISSIQYLPKIKQENQGLLLVN